MRPEYDFSGGQRGVTARRYEEGANVVVISPDVLDVFPDGVAVTLSRVACSGEACQHVVDGSPW